MKKINVFFCLLMLVVLGFGYAPNFGTTAAFPLFKGGDARMRVGGFDSVKPIPPIDTAKADTVVKYIYSALGTKYVWAGCTPKGGYDCSGLLYWAYKKVGYTIIRSSQGLAKMGVGIDSADATHGDVILFKGTDANSKGVGHVGVVVSKKGERLRFIHASSAKKHMKVVETTFAGSYYIKRYLGIRRVLGVTQADTTHKK